MYKYKLKKGENMEEYVLIGKILKPHGIKGEVKVEFYSEDPEYMLDVPSLIISPHQTYCEGKEAKLEKIRYHKKAWLSKFSTINNRNEAEAIRGWYVYIASSYLPPLEEGEYYVKDIIGMEVWTIDGVLVGTLENIIYGIQDTYEVVHPNTGKVNLIPAVDEFVKEIDFDKNKITIKPIEGMIEL